MRLGSLHNAWARRCLTLLAISSKEIGLFTEGRFRFKPVPVFGVVACASEASTTLGPAGAAEASAMGDSSMLEPACGAASAVEESSMLGPAGAAGASAMED